MMVCTDMSEAEQVRRQLLQFNNACLITYQNVGDMVCNRPSDGVALVILATDNAPQPLAKTLSWLRNVWPESSLAVIGNKGCGDYEIASRAHGAVYLTRPVSAEQWSALVKAGLRKSAAGRNVRAGRKW